MDMKKILQAMDGASTKPVEGASDMSKFLSVVSESKYSKTNRMSTAEQLVVQEYSKPQVRETITNPVLNVAKDATPSMIGKYFKTVEEEIQEATERSKDRARQLAERVSNKINESPIAMDPAEPNNPMIHGHEKANPMTLKGRIMQARAQLKELAELAERDDLLAWEEICKKAKGGMFMGLEQNLEQIRHGISELAAKRKKGGTQSRGIDKNIGEAGSPAQQAAIAIAMKKAGKKPKTEGLGDPKDNPCWKGYHPVGTKKKGGKTVPNCVPKEDVQKTGVAGQLRGKDKVDVKGTVLGSPEKSQKGLRGKLVGGGA